jgi:cell division protein FtsB
MLKKDNLFKLLPYLKNKYVLAILIFIVWISFIDENRLIDRFDAIKEVNNLKEQNNYYKEQIAKNNTKLNELQTNKENLERFAREQYLMKKPNEDVFVIVQEIE